MVYRKATKVSFILVLSLVIFSCGGNSGSSNSSNSQLHPNGVNLGGDYVLEDWFFSSSQVDHYVATPCTYADTGIASSQIFAQSTSVPDFTWTSETQMIQQFSEQGYTDSQIEALFTSHRANYLLDPTRRIDNLNSVFSHIRSLGIREVRLPITWAITYPTLSYTINPGNGGSPVVVPATTQVTLIQDPFYPDLEWATIPIGQVMQVLKTASKHGIKVLLDIHAYPGGSSDGTYNGIWPLQPEFWNTGLDSNNIPIYQDNFQTIFQNLITWADSLYKMSDKSYADGLGGLTAMNEPAHLMGIPAARCSDGSWGITSYQDVLDTLALAVSDFRQSSLPRHNVKLYMNIIETMFPTTMTGDQIYSAIGTWWNSVTTSNERHKWAVLDLHHYFAWDGNCNSCLQNYVTNGVIQQAGFDQMKQCSDDWYLTIRDKLGLSAKDKLATTEFSASANSDTYQSCASGNAQPTTPSNYEAYRNAVLKYQLDDAKQANIDMYFWTWTIPYNDNFQNEWSLINILK